MMMRLYMFRASSDIPVKGMEKVAEKVSHVFGVDISIFTGPVYGGVDSVTIEHLLRISDRFLVRGEPVVAIVFTEESVDDRDVLGEASQLDRGAWVRWSGDIQRVTVTVLHELGHLCDAYHCVDESCVMFYAYREHSKFSFSDLFCEKCRSTIQNSWVYNRLVQASADRARKRQTLPRIVESTPLNLTKSTKSSARTQAETSVINEEPSYAAGPPFPDWSLASTDKEEFIRRVREHFGCGKRT
jgi:hypothetical protein